MIVVVFKDHVWGSNIRPMSNPYLASAAVEFVDALVKGRAVEKVDPSAPPLAIERQERDR